MLLIKADVFTPFCHHSILGRIIRVTQEVDEYREWIRKNWGNATQNDLTLNSRLSFLFLEVHSSEKNADFMSGD